MSERGSILIVDDQVDLTDTLRELFVSRGYDVEVAMNAGDALMLVMLDRPDAVVLDIRLPDRNGDQILPEILALDDSIPVVMLSGCDDEALARATLAAGALDYVRKPFDFAILERAVTLAVAVGRRRRERGVVIPLSAARRDPSRSSARRNVGGRPGTPGRALGATAGQRPRFGRPRGHAGKSGL